MPSQIWAVDVMLVEKITKVVAVIVVLLTIMFLGGCCCYVSVVVYDVCQSNTLLLEYCHLYLLLTSYKVELGYV